MIGTVFILACAMASLLDFAMPKWKVDQNVRIEDAYKWLYQATRGGEHAAPDREMTKRWLDDEWDSLGTPAKDEPLWEPLCRDGSIGRLNLRVFKARGGTKDTVLDAFLASGREYREVGTNFIDRWVQLGSRLKKRPAGRLTYDEWIRLDAVMAAKNYPAVHHSEPYEHARKPAYRLVTGVEMKKLKL